MDASFPRSLTLPYPASPELTALEVALNSAPSSMALRQALAQALYKLGCQLHAQKNHDPRDTLAVFDRLLLLSSNSAAVHNARGAVLARLGRVAEAEAAFRRALSLQPDETSALENLTGLLHKAQRYEENLSIYRQWIGLESARVDGLFGRLAYTRRLLANWTDDEEITVKLERSVQSDQCDIFPFEFLGFSDDPALHSRCAQAWCLKAHPMQDALHAVRPAAASSRLRIAYLSNDFCNHATAILMARVLELHDRHRFEIFAISWTSQHDEMTLRLRRGVEHFIEVGGMTDQDVARWMADNRIDIAIDIKGLASGYRLGIFAYRPAPVQIQYLGYPGSLGVPYIDYLIADRHIIPADLASCYEEKIIRLPHSYQANDPLRSVATDAGHRVDHGLPEQGLVLACFNNPYKFTPEVFATWMEILSQLPGSVLWLLAPGMRVRENLMEQARSFGVPPSRLIFAERVPTDQHLARHQHVDLFLDTFPVNAHTTAADALWMGVPVLTRFGRSFASRVGLSLLNACGLEADQVQQLAVANLQAYRQQAIALGRSPDQLAALRFSLQQARAHAPLFDAQRLCRDLEVVYAKVWQQWLEGQPMQGFDLPDMGPVATRDMVHLPDPAQLQRDSLQKLESGDLTAAISVFDQALQTHPNMAELWQVRAHTRLRVNDPAQRLAGRDDLREAHRLAPHNSRIAWELALTLYATGDPTAADELLLKLQQAMPRIAQYPAQRVLHARQEGNVEKALQIAREWTRQQPENGTAWVQLASAALACHRRQEAALAAKRALRIDPNLADAHNQLGILARNDHGPEREAVEHFLRAYHLAPDNAWYISNIALTLDELGQEIEARQWWTLLANKQLSDERDLLMLQAHACERLQQLAAAIERYQRVTRHFPEHIDAWLQLGHVCTSHGRDAEAVVAYRAAVALQPTHVHALAALTRAERCIADWDHHEQRLQQLEEIARIGSIPINPFLAAVLWNDPVLQKRAAEMESAVIASAVPEGGLGSFDHAPWSPGCGRRLRVGYFSADFHNHATAYLMVQMLESHDRNRVEIFAYSWGPSARDHAYRQRLERGIEHFHDLNGWGARPIAELARRHGLDIAVDLKGHTRQGLPHVFAWRAAPLQINYLGYPGTLGAPWMDYIVADHTLIGDDDFGQYTEQVVRLPGAYQCNDLHREVASPGMDRLAAGLPPEGLVLCCFNATFKISPEIFDVWLDLLRHIHSAVLWLFDKDAGARKRLRERAQKQGVDPARIVFAPYAPLAQHLARYRLADIFLDTLPYNAHTTASDALWVGTPVLTVKGRTFASRVCASLLHQLELDELVVDDLTLYKEKALALLNNPERLRAIRCQLQSSPLREQLFDGRRIAQQMESVYEHIAARHASGQKPQHFDLRSAMT